MYLQSVFRTVVFAGIICLASVVSPVFASDDSVASQLQKIHSDAEQKKLSGVSIGEMKADVIDKLGEPSDTQYYKDEETLAWYYNGWEGKVSTRISEWNFDIVRVTFKEGQVYSIQARLTQPFKTSSEMDELYDELWKLSPAEGSIGGPNLLMSDFWFNREGYNIHYLSSYQDRFVWIEVAGL